MSSVIWWMRRDFRLTDNQALASAMESGLCVAGFYFRPCCYWIPVRQRNAMTSCGEVLQSLDHDLRQRGSYLTVRNGDVAQAELSRLMNETEAQMVFAEPDYTPYASNAIKTLNDNLLCNGWAAQLFNLLG